MLSNLEQYKLDANEKIKKFIALVHHKNNMKMKNTIGSDTLNTKEEATIIAKLLKENKKLVYIGFFSNVLEEICNEYKVNKQVEYILEDNIYKYALSVDIYIYFYNKNIFSFLDMSNQLVFYYSPLEQEIKSIEKIYNEAYDNLELSRWSKMLDIDIRNCKNGYEVFLRKYQGTLSINELKKLFYHKGGVELFFLTVHLVMKYPLFKQKILYIQSNINKFREQFSHTKTFLSVLG